VDMDAVRAELSGIHGELEGLAAAKEEMASLMLGPGQAELMQMQLDRCLEEVLQLRNEMEVVVRGRTKLVSEMEASQAKVAALQGSCSKLNQLSIPIKS
jgi:uncharacterized protein (DUF3084 family)